ncbi:MAG TPA: DedA family protein [Longimicrobiales bacterium]
MDYIIDQIKFLIDFILHIDEHLTTIIARYGTWTYAILFAIIFVETGLVVMPFLPGDSLLFAAGAFASKGALNPVVLTLLLSVAAILGDTVNYWIGRYFGPRVFTENRRFLNKRHLDRAQEFYERHGGKAIVFARFVPIVRTFAPFVAGVGAMNYGRFLFYNVTGGVVWITLFVWAGYFFGNIPAVEKNFELVIFAIIGLSVVPMVIEYWKERKRSRVSA